MDDAIEQTLEYRVDEMTIRCSTTDEPTQGPERLEVLSNSQRRYEITLKRAVIGLAMRTSTRASTWSKVLS